MWIYLKTRAVHTVELASGDFAVRRVYLSSCILLWGTSGEVLVVKNSPANAGDIRDIGSVPGLGGSPGGGHGNPLQYSCLEILRTEESGGLLSTGLQRARHD